MTKAGDRIAVDAARAAALIKTTAESTATALNIQYIQKDILEIKESIKLIISTQDGKIQELEKKIDSLQRAVAMGIGIASTIAFTLPILINLFFK